MRTYAIKVLIQKLRSEILLIGLRIFMRLQEILKCKIVQNADDMKKKYWKYPEWNSFYDIFVT